MPYNIKGQNLVPNGDFEQYIGCPTGDSQLSLAVSWINPATNIAFVSGTPDYYNQCATSGTVSVPGNWGGNQPAHSGVAYSGIYLWINNSPPNSREYIEVQLTSPLISETCYDFEMYVNLADACNYTTDNIGIYFSNTAITGVNNYYPLPYTPQINNVTGNIFDDSNWVLVSGNYMAQGGENYLIIGNFNNDLNTGTVGVTGTWDIAYVYIDDVSLIVAPCTGIPENHQEEIKIYPNPVKYELYINSYPGKTEIIISDILGKEIYRNQFSTSPVPIQTGNFQLPTSNYLPGIYFIEIHNGKNIFRKKFLKE